MKVASLSRSLGLQVSGGALQDCSSGELAEALRLVERAGLVVFRRQCLDDGDLHALARRIGPLEESSRKVCLSPEHPEISYLSNLRDEDGQFIGFPGADTDYWHSDQQHRERPATLAVLYCVVPAASGGATSFVSADVESAGLDEATVADLAGRRAVYEPAFNHDNAPRVRVSHPALLTSRTGDRHYAYVSDNTLGFTGLAADESAALKQRVLSRLLEPSRIYAHRWQAGDFALYDNTQLLHRRERFQGRRWLKAAKVFAPEEIFAVPSGEVVSECAAATSSAE
ncbi:2,4-dichlorophenoxyacetate dioxygenase [Amycolatopsis sp. AA4]|uniref:TauD/TfdA dioxygenase family protein n=1 Tax=Actinomycetes TaxID=1760 RepID=UPI0001B55A0A|nr:MULTISPECIES: TauD/TfdA family dioxygenase [Actinomycetes]ATY09110.1 2,4-dichlorophenoxyacetate dioxygenase [Amycolatopsis sp. AA4]EFL04400.1 hypothetical protein SSMG_00071 [Streptomyces sp. AA4]